MKTWNSLFIRHGWKLEQTEENVFSCEAETKENMKFLLESLDEVGVSYFFTDDILTLSGAVIAEDQWIEIIDFEYRGRGEGLWFQPGKQEPKVRELDTYISGIVRQLNRLGFYTKGSCDGHGRRAAHVLLTKERGIEPLVQMLLAMGMKRVYYRETEQSYRLNLPLDRPGLLDLAERMDAIQRDWLEKGYDYMKEQLFYQLLEQLLSIPGESGREGRIRGFVRKRLAPFVDHIATDRSGNLLAEKTYRSGHGPTILLNAHLDTVIEFEPDRVIKKNDGVWSSSKGILGADDRVGVAVLLHVAEYLYRSNFSGKVKFIFTVEEECGLVGARQVDEYFLWGTDAAIVVDRRGKGDIVTSCGGYIPFCEKAYGRFFEETAQSQGLDGWACTNGGSSDTRIWAEHGIQSVNLSVGYQSEHTDDECLDVAACYETAKLVKGVFEKARELQRVLQRLEREQFVQTIVEKRGQY